MTNYEYYKEEIDKIARMGRKAIFDKYKKKIRVCVAGPPCESCAFEPPDSTKSCNEIAVEWAEAEYIEPKVDWSKVPIDTPILVRDTEESKWHKRHFAGVKEGKVTAWAASKTSWTASDDPVVYWNYAKLAEQEKGGIICFI